jgi:hypothetical protein
VRLRDNNRLKIPNNILKNPLHKDQPFTVNLYFKKDVPPPGYYDPIYPNSIDQTLNNENKHSYKYIFNSNYKSNKE